MSIDYKQFRFASAPRTGTTWFIQACEAAGLGQGFKAHVHAPFTEQESGAFKVSLVRHPYYWLTSYFKSILPGSTGIPEIDKLRFPSSVPLSVTMVDDFENFINTYLHTCPGQVSRIFDSYGADSYLKIEDMPCAVTELFRSLGVPAHLRNKCRYIDPQNKSKLHIPKDLELYRRVMDAEQEMVDRYEYF